MLLPVPLTMRTSSEPSVHLSVRRSQMTLPSLIGGVTSHGLTRSGRGFRKG
jgi:hypothetical protein